MSTSCSVIIRWGSSLIAGVFLLAGCAKKETAAVPLKGSSTVASYLAGGNNVTLYYAAFQKANIATDSAYLSGGPYTLFVPTDSAFLAAGITADSINRMDTADLDHLIRYTIVKGIITPTSITGNNKWQAICLDSARPIIYKSYYGLFFNGISLVTPDIELGDGVINTMSSVPIFPKLTVQQLIQTLPELSIFNSVMNMSIANGSGISNVYQKIGKTIFAPTNDGFAAIGLPTSDSIIQWENGIYSRQYLFTELTEWDCTGDGDTQTSSSGLGSFLTYTVSAAEFLGGYAVGSGAGPNTLNGPYTLGSFTNGTQSQFTILADGRTILSPGNTTNPHIVKADILATDGIIHEVDQPIFTQVVPVF